MAVSNGESSIINGIQNRLLLDRSANIYKKKQLLYILNYLHKPLKALYSDLGHDLEDKKVSNLNFRVPLNKQVQAKGKKTTMLIMLLNKSPARSKSPNINGMKSASHKKCYSIFNNTCFGHYINSHSSGNNSNRSRNIYCTELKKRIWKGSNVIKRVNLSGNTTTQKDVFQIIKLHPQSRNSIAKRQQYSSSYTKPKSSIATYSSHTHNTTVVNFNAYQLKPYTDKQSRKASFDVPSKFSIHIIPKKR